MKKIAKHLILITSERHFFMDENNDPNKFEFTIETVGVIEPLYTYFKYEKFIR